ncbi:hypothetical protein ES703_01493 [subsurface metagenome]
MPWQVWHLKIPKPYIGATVPDCAFFGVSVTEYFAGRRRSYSFNLLAKTIPTLIDPFISPDQLCKLLRENMKPII